MHLNLQDLIAILGPIGAVLGFTWYHFNRKFEKIEDKLDNVDKRLGEKIDAVRDRVSRIEGQLPLQRLFLFMKIQGQRKKPKENNRWKYNSVSFV